MKRAYHTAGGYYSLQIVNTTKKLKMEKVEGTKTTRTLIVQLLPYYAWLNVIVSYCCV